jgi:hypothetical protein
VTWPWVVLILTGGIGGALLGVTLWVIWVRWRKQ